MQLRFVFAVLAAVLVQAIPSVANAELFLANDRPFDGTPDGTFQWEAFTGTFAGPHAGTALAGSTGSATLSATAFSPDNPPFPPALITSTQNDLYSGSFRASWSIALNGLTAGNPFTSVAVQVGVAPGTIFVNGAPTVPGSNLIASNFTINNVAPTTFELYGTSSTGANYYFASWDGLAAASNYVVNIDGASSGHHTLFGGASAAYYNVAAVPEPASMAVLGLAAGCGIYRKMRRRQATKAE